VKKQKKKGGGSKGKKKREADCFMLYGNSKQGNDQEDEECPGERKGTSSKKVRKGRGAELFAN